MQDIRRDLKTAVVLLLILVMTFSLSACGGGKDVSSLDYLDQEILITGLTDEDFTVTVKELTELDAVSKKADASRFDGDDVEVKAYGPTLNSFLEKYDKKQTDFELIRFTAKDKYAIAIPESVLSERDVILSYMDDDAALDSENMPVHVVVPGERAMYWVRMLEKIEFDTDANAVSSDRVVFLDNVLPKLGGEEVEDGLAVSVEELLEEYGGGGKVLMTAKDGLQKKETLENFAGGYLKYTGEYATKFTGPEIPEGMHVNEVVSILCGDVIFYSLEEGIGFSDIVKDKQFRGAAKYAVVDLDGNEIKISDEQLSSGVFTKDGDAWSFKYKGDKVIKNVAVIETI